VGRESCSPSVARCASVSASERLAHLRQTLVAGNRAELIAGL
jgi:hypothetical protein